MTIYLILIPRLKFVYPKIGNMSNNWWAYQHTERFYKVFLKTLKTIKTSKKQADDHKILIMYCTKLLG